MAGRERRTPTDKNRSTFKSLAFTNRGSKYAVDLDFYEENPKLFNVLRQFADYSAILGGFLRFKLVRRRSGPPRVKCCGRKRSRFWRKFWRIQICRTGNREEELETWHVTGRWWVQLMWWYSTGSFPLKRRKWRSRVSCWDLQPISVHLRSFERSLHRTSPGNVFDGRYLQATPGCETGFRFFPWLPNHFQIQPPDCETGFRFFLWLQNQFQVLSWTVKPVSDCFLGLSERIISSQITAY